jgi:HSP20 family molecular chaperone IbpA
MSSSSQGSPQSDPEREKKVEEQSMRMVEEGSPTPVSVNQQSEESKEKDSRVEILSEKPSHRGVSKQRKQRQVGRFSDAMAFPFSPRLNRWLFDPFRALTDRFSWTPPVSLLDVDDDLASTPLAQMEPKLDFIETDAAYEIDVELPGAKKEDLKVQVTEDADGDVRLLVTGHKRHVRRHKEGGVVHLERSEGNFSRIVSLPADAEKDNINCRFEDGVLKISVPKHKVASDESAWKRIEISS